MSVAGALRRRSQERACRLTDVGNAQRFAIAHGDRLRYVKAWNRWLLWDGRRWHRDELGAEIKAAKEVVQGLFDEAANAYKVGDANNAQAKALAKWAGASSSARAIAAMVTLARSEEAIAASPDQFDRDPWAFNVLNGTLDLRAGELRPHSPGDMNTMLARTVYEPNAPAPMWAQFLERILPDPEVRCWTQRFLGYALTGDVREQVLAFAYGGGANGKSVLLDVVLGVVGDYGLRAAPDLLLSKHGEAHPTELADLEGRRIVIVSEIEQGRVWSEATIKRITGDSTITARRMRQDFYTFPATHKAVVAANTKPNVRGNDHGIWRRLRMVPFVVTIPEPERDKELIPKLLRSEASGILAWLVRGCLDWQRVGLGEPKAIADATSNYRSDQDVLGHWLDERCVLLPEAWTPTAALYANYCSWCQETGRTPWTRETVRERLLERGDIQVADRGVGRGLRGVGLRSGRHEGASQ